MLHENSYGVVFALSPSPARLDDFLAALAEEMPSIGEPQRRARTLTPNHLAVAMWLRLVDDNILLGADVEEARVHGWSLILQSRPAFTRGPAFSRSPTTDLRMHINDPVWKQFCCAEVLTVLAPYVLGATQLPERSDVARIVSLSAQAYATTSLTARSPRRHLPAVEKEFREHGVKLRTAQPPTGHVRLRRIAGGGEPWRVELRNNAVPLRLVHG
jgi:hypothetical protein